MTSREPGALKRLRTVCLSFPEAHETKSEGHVAFAVGNKVFAIVEQREKGPCLSLRIGPEDYAERSRESRLLSEAGIAKPGWILLRLTRDVSWDEVMDVVLMSYVTVAPKKTLKALQHGRGLHD